METLSETAQFYDTIESVYNLFEPSICKVGKASEFHDCFFSNPTLKALNSTRWSGRYDAVYALKDRFYDVMKCLNHTLYLPAQTQKKEMEL